jgi:O-antigen ligase
MTAAYLIPPLLYTGSIAVVLGFACNMPWLLRCARSPKGRVRLLAIAWFFMFIAKLTFEDWRGTTRAPITGLGGMDLSAVHQVVCGAIGGALALLLVVSTRGVAGTFRRAAPLCLLLYAGFAFLSTSYSPARGFTAYKASLLLVDVMLVGVAVLLLRTRDEAKLLANLGYFLAYLFTITALVGALLVPERAFPFDPGSMFGARLNGVIPSMDQNTLGFLAAIPAVVGFIRFFGATMTSRRLYWGGQAVACFIVLFLTQTRTALAALFLALVFCTVVIPRLRAYAWGLVAASLLVAAVSVVTYGGTEWYDSAVSNTRMFFKRGDEAETIRGLHGRVDTWFVSGARMIADSPLLGHGYAAGTRFLGPEYGMSVTHMHNSHLEVLTNSGVIGYAAWLGMVLGVAASAFTLPLRRHSRAEQEELYFRAEGAGVLLIMLMACMTTSEILEHARSFVLFLGLLVYYEVSRGPQRRMAAGSWQLARDRARVGRSLESVGGAT